MRLNPKSKKASLKIIISKFSLLFCTIFGFGIATLSLVGCKREKLEGKIMPEGQNDTISKNIQCDTVVRLAGEIMPESSIKDEETDETVSK